MRKKTFFEFVHCEEVISSSDRAAAYEEAENGLHQKTFFV